MVAAIPCFNTEPFVAAVIAKARKHVDQVILIDDGSCDGTAEAGRAAGALVIRHNTNRGYGEAIKSCFEAAEANDADVLVILDGDGQHNPNEIPKLLAPLSNGKIGLIVGSRFLTKKCNMPRYRRFGISVITFFWNLGSKVKVSDTQSGFRAYRRELFQDFSLAEKGMSVSIETLESTRRKKVAIKEIPISCHYVSSRLNLKAIRHGLSVVLAVVKIRIKSNLHSLFKK